MFSRSARQIAASLVFLSAAIPTLHAEAQDPPTLTIVEPVEGSTVYSQTFNLLVSTSGDTQGARLDHYHWMLSGGPNLTAADLSGAIEVVAPADGDYSIVTYMATPEHVVIGQKKTVHFKVVTTGATILAPTEGALLTTSDPVLYYNLYGNPPAETTLHIKLDSADTVVDADLDGQFALQGLADGHHSISVWVTNASDVLVGEIVTRQFDVASALNVGNLRKAIKYVASSGKGNARSAKSTLSKLKTLLTSMKNGGTAQATSPQLTASNVDHALKLLSSAQKAKGASAKKRLKSLQKYLTTLLPST